MFEIGTYKVHRIGKSLMVAIPHQWVQQNGVRKGDTVTFKVTGKGRLMLETVKTEVEDAEGG